MTGYDAEAFDASRPGYVGTRAAVGERLQPGDRAITGLTVNARVRAGDEVVAELGALGRVGLRIT